MGLENPSTLLELVPTWPTNDSDDVSQGDDHIRIIKAMLVNLWPVGSVVYSTNNVNPGTYIGGTWAAIGDGRAVVGAGTRPGGETFGADDVTLTKDQIPAHTHPPGTLVTDDPGNHTHSLNNAANSLQVSSGSGTSVSGLNAGTTGGSGAHTHTLTGDTGENDTLAEVVSVIQASVAVYMWERTA